MDICRKNIRRGVYCAAMWCSNFNGCRIDKTISFFRFPKQADRARRWVQFCLRDDLIGKHPEDLKHLRLCSDHFDKSQFQKEKPVIKLHSYACPTIYEYRPLDSELVIPRKNIKLERDASPSVFPDLLTAPGVSQCKFLKEKKSQKLKKTSKKTPVRNGRKQLLQIIPGPGYSEENYVAKQAKEDVLAFSKPETIPEKGTEQISVEDDRDEEFAREVENGMESHSTPICRLCASLSEDTIPIFENKQSNSVLLEKIHIYLPIRITAGDVLPTTVCQNCITKLEICHNLVQDCLDADAVLKTMFGLGNSNNEVQHRDKNVFEEQSCHNEGTLNSSMDENILCEVDVYTNLTEVKFEVEDNDTLIKEETSTETADENDCMQNNDTFQNTNTISLDSRLEEESSTLQTQVENEKPNKVNKSVKRRRKPHFMLNVEIMRGKNEKVNDDVELKNSLQLATKPLMSEQHYKNQKLKKEHESLDIPSADNCFVDSHKEISSSSKSLEEDLGHICEQIASEHAYNRKNMFTVSLLH